MVCSSPDGNHGGPLHVNGVTNNNCENGMQTKRDSAPDDQFRHPMSLEEVRVLSFYAVLMSLVLTATQRLSVQFRKRAHETVDYICDYYAHVDEMPVRAQVEVLLTLCRCALSTCSVNGGLMQ